MTKTVGILAKSGSKEIATTAKALYKTIQEQGLTIIPDEYLARTQGLPGGRPLARIKADLLVTVGGDGTVLKAARELSNPKMPILAVNMGRRGYLTEVDPPAFQDAIHRWSQGKFQLERLWKIAVTYGNKTIGEGLNEALLTPNLAAKMLSLDLSLRRSAFYSARADGLIIATPTGSTAHAFSAGGPVLDGSLDSFALAFIAPLQPVRSMVVDTNSGLRVRIGKPGPDAYLSIDGQLQRSIRAGQTLAFRRSANSSFFVRFDDTFLQRSLRRLSPEREPT